jgi:hypothetical protein
MADGNGSVIHGTIYTIVGLGIGIIMIAAFLIPITVNALGNLVTSGIDGASMWVSLLQLVVVISIIGLIIVAIDGFMGNRYQG